MRKIFFLTFITLDGVMQAQTQPKIIVATSHMVDGQCHTLMIFLGQVMGGRWAGHLISY
jgi:hypothetical protein